MVDMRQKALRDYSRAVAGGLLVGLPLLYTMEVWFDGASLPPARIVVLVSVAFVLVVAFNLIAGFRRDRTLLGVVVDSVEAMGIAMGIATVTLWLIGQLDDAALSAAAGKIALESIPVAFGVSLARTQFSGPSGDGAATGKGKRSTRKRGGEAASGAEANEVELMDQPGRAHAGPGGRLVLTAAGALIFALNIAPTEEVVLVAASTDGVHLVALVIASLLVTLALVFWANFAGGGAADGSSPLDQPVAETVAAYATSLGVALLLLWAFGRTSNTGPAAILSMIVVLGFVAAVGGAVGRLLIGGGSEQDGSRRGEAAA